MSSTVVKINLQGITQFKTEPAVKQFLAQTADEIAARARGLAPGRAKNHVVAFLDKGGVAGTVARIGYDTKIRGTVLEAKYGALARSLG